MTEPRSDDIQRARSEAALAHRVDELERETRRLRRFTTSLLVGTGVLLGVGAAMLMVSGRYGVPGTVADVVAARQFVLRGQDGTIRGAWGTERDGTLRLALHDTKGRPRTKLNLVPDGSSGLSFSDSAGHARAVFALLPDETASIVLADEGGKTRSVLGISPDGNATLVFADRNGVTRAGLGVDGRGGGTFTLVDRTGRDAAAPEPEAEPEPVDTGAADEARQPARRR